MVAARARWRGHVGIPGAGDRRAGSPIQRAVELKRVCRPRFVPMHMLVKTPEELAERLQQGSFFLRQILEQGRVLYERQ